MEDVLCQICYYEYSIERPITQLKPCNHSLCKECLKLSVLKKCLCPFCKQMVANALTEETLNSMDELKQQFPAPSEKEEN
jgi:hypothetical protein